MPISLKLPIVVGWAVFLALAFSIYSVSFNGYRILETSRQSVVGEADVSSFQILIRDFSLKKKYGDPYRLEGRQVNDIAQKHKIHHVLYVMVASLLYKVFSFFYDVFGLPSHQALYSINAFFGCLNIYLLFIFLKQIDSEKKQKGIFLLFYAFCLSSWIFHSVPESWTFSATLMLFFLVLHYKRRLNPLLLAVYIGFAMLNNIFLGTLCFFLIIYFWLSSESVKAFITNSSMAIVIAGVTWLMSMTFLSIFDADFRPDHYFQYTFWFKKHIAPQVIIFDPYFWKAALSQLYITSILSNQSVPNVPQESLLYTIEQSRLGLVSTGVYLSLLLTLGWRAAKHVFAEMKTHGGLDALFSNFYVPLALYAAAWLFLTVIMDSSGAFLYSTMVTPIIVAVLYRFTDWQRMSHKILWAGVLGAVFINNLQQVIIFRAALQAMSQ